MERQWSHPSRTEIPATLPSLACDNQKKWPCLPGNSTIQPFHRTCREHLLDEFMSKSSLSHDLKNLARWIFLINEYSPHFFKVFKKSEIKKKKIWELTSLWRLPDTGWRAGENRASGSQRSREEMGGSLFLIIALRMVAPSLQWWLSYCWISFPPPLKTALTSTIIPGYIFLRSFILLFVGCGTPKYWELNACHSWHMKLTLVRAALRWEGCSFPGTYPVSAALCNCSTDPTIIVVDPDTAPFRCYIGPL